MSEKKTVQGVSASFIIKPLDSRCKYWAKKILADAMLPIPSEVDGASDIPTRYLRLGDEELVPGDFLFEGEAIHHRHQRGWSYCVSYVDENGNVHRYTSGFSDQKMAAKAQGMSPELLAGSGDVAGAVRVAHAIRQNMLMPGDLGSW